MSSNYPRGSQWHKWDLHVHTPASYTWEDSHDDKTYEKIIKKMNESDVVAFAITDYWTFDGFKKLMDVNKKLPDDKKLKKTIFPGIELRFDILTDGSDKKRVNFQIIFNIDDGLDKSLYRIDQFYKHLRLSSTEKIIDRQSFIDIAKDYSDDVLQKLVGKKRSVCKDKDFLIAGYKSCYISYDCLIDIFNNNKDLKDNCFILVPWDKYGGISKIDSLLRDDIKKKLTKLADILETGNEETIKLFLLNKDLLKNKVWSNSWKQFLDNKLKPCICGSDAKKINAIGLFPDNKACWIKSEPSFEGLKQIIYEPVGRVYTKKQPEIIKKVKNNQTKYISSLSINQVKGYKGERGTWFDKIEIKFNKELVAIIGNKGNGKSAITDILGLLANSKNYNHFSFLNTTKFKKGKLASNFTGKLTWESGNYIEKNLNDEVNEDKIETIKYLPQNYFEILCGDIDNKDFKKELEQVVFAHLEDKDKLEQNDFQSLISYKSTNVHKAVQILKNKLSDINQKIVKLERKKNEKYKNELRSKLEQKQKELKSHEKNKPKEVKAPKGAKSNQNQFFQKIKTLNAEAEKISKEIKKHKATEKELTAEIEDLKQFNGLLDSKKIELTQFKNDYKDKLAKYDLDINKIITIKIDKKSLSSKILEKQNELLLLRNQFLTEDQINQQNIEDKEKEKLKKESSVFRYNNIMSQIKKLQGKLDEQTQKYQDYLESYSEWKKKKQEIEGDEDTPETLKFYQKELSFIENELHDNLKKLREDRIKIAIDIFNKKKEIIEIYQKIKESIDSIISSKKQLLKDYQIGVEAGFDLETTFTTDKGFFGYINQSAAGSFRNIDGGNKKLKEIFDGKDLDDKNEIKLILNKIIEYLEVDQRQEFKDKNRYIDDQIKNPLDFYNYLFSLDYLKENYKLRLGKKDLDELSPGERGALLLVFYLMLDKNDIPLVIDQPEDNLDNQSIAQILVPFIKEAKTKRQIIMVTHNPNLAVVADAEQIIYVNIDKKSGKNEFSFKSGAIENPEINKCIVNVLEGTMPAFDKRRLKYFQKTSTN
jgi:ABC-type lipoprotein export system ATPase subunit